ncbi:MAG: DUF937 domain-containing protein [Lactovum sp.]
MDISSILGALGDTGTKELSKATGVSDSQVTDLITAALPTILGAMQKNAKDSKSAESLSKALDDHASSDISDVSSFLKNVDLDDGAKILSHVLGNDKSAVQNNLTEKTGLDSGQVTQILTSLAPLLLTFLGQKKQESSDNDLLSLFTGLVSGNKSSLLGSLLGLFKK